MATQHEVIKKFVEALDITDLKGTAAVDDAIRYCSTFKSYSDLIDHLIMDRKLSDSGDDFLKRYCGIDLNNEDTGAITGKDAGGNVVKTAESVVPETEGGTSIYPPNNSFSYKGLTIKVPSKSTLNKNQQNIIAGLYTWWLKAGIDLVEETYGFSFQNSDVTFKTINVDFDENRWTHSFSVNGDKQVNEFTLHINSNIFSSITNSDTNGKNSSSNEIEYLDRVIAFSFARALMMAKVNYELDLPDTISKGIATQVDGYDDRRKNEIIELTDNVENLMKCTVSSKGEIPSNKFNIPMGFVALRYLAKQASDQSSVETDIKIPADAFEYNGHYYYIYSNVASNWEGAQKYCENFGGHLAVINDSAENTALFNYMKSKGYDSAYFGLSDAVQEGNWNWVDGTPVTYTNWTSGEPNGGRSENYGMFYQKYNYGKWNDGSFSYDVQQHTANFICEWEKSIDDEVEIDEETTLEVINLFQGLSDSEKEIALQENVKSLESLKSLIEGDKNVEIIDEETGKTVFTDLDNTVQFFGGFFNDDPPVWLNDLTKYKRDKNFHIVYRVHDRRDSHGNLVYVQGHTIKDFDLDANGERIPIELNYDRDKVGAGLGLFGNITSAIDSITKIWKYKLSGAELGKEISNISSCAAGLVGNISDLGGFAKTGAIAPIVSSALSAIGSFIALTDGVEPKEIVDVFSKTLQFSTTLIQKFSTSDFLKTTKFGDFLKTNPIGQKLTANTLKANLITAGVLGIYMGGVQYFESAEKYAIDGLDDSLATKDKWIDAFGTATKTFSNVVTLGLDDVAFETLFSAASGLTYGVQWLWTKITGGDTSQVKLNTTGGKTYTEFIGDWLKLVLFNQTTGTKNDDDIINDTPHAKIFSAEGNDHISNFASNVQIYSGVGNDKIFCHEKTEGNYLDGGNDEDIIFFYGASNEVHGGYGNDSISAYSDGKTPLSGNIIYGEAGNDVILIDDSHINKNARSSNTINGGTGDDIIILDKTRNSNVIQYNNGDGNDQIFGYDSNDQIRINKSDYTTQFDGDDVKIIVGSGSMTLYDAKDKKLNIIQTDEDIMPVGVSADYYKTTLTISNKFRGANISLEDYAETFTKVNASKLAKTQPVQIIGNNSGNYIKGGKGNDTISGGSGIDLIYGGEGDDIISGGKGNDKLYGESGNDIISGGSGNDTLTGGGGNDIFVHEGGDDFITDYKSGVDKIFIKSGLITDSFLNGSNVVLETSNGSITVKNCKNKKITVVDFLGNETTNIYPISTIPAGISIKNSILTASNKFTDSEIDIADYPTVTKINASAVYQPLKIFGSSENNSIKGGKNADIIYGGAGNDTVSLGGGADTYVYSYGDDLIQDYTAGQDKIKLDGNTIIGSKLSGSNVILQTYGGSITVKNGKNKKITVVDTDGNETSKIYPIDNLPQGLSLNNNVLTASTKFTEEKIDLEKYSCVEKVNANAVKSDIYIVGNSNNNSLRGGKSYSSLWGGASDSDDTLYGGSSNVFIYGKNEGNDVIRNAKNTDMVKLYNVNFSDLNFSVLSNKMILSVESGTLTIENKKTPILQTADGSLHQYNYKTHQWNNL